MEAHLIIACYLALCNLFFNIQNTEPFGKQIETVDSKE